MTICRSRILRGFSQFKASKANLVYVTLNFLLSGNSVISGGRVTWERVSQWLLLVLGRRGDEHQVSRQHSCFSSTLIYPCACSRSLFFILIKFVSN